MMMATIVAAMWRKQAAKSGGINKATEKAMKWKISVIASVMA